MVNVRYCSSSDRFVVQLVGCSWRGLTCSCAVGDGFVCVSCASFCINLSGLCLRYDVHPWI